mmetsp:Transcript_17147/g.47284  ORF Transcript_17147/g.47284 Transcript_17147/m.47284 type:complete len:132 (-) Transcript_17147:198-593(-)
MPSMATPKHFHSVPEHSCGSSPLHVIISRTIWLLRAAGPFTPCACAPSDSSEPLGLSRPAPEPAGLHLLNLGGAWLLRAAATFLKSVTLKALGLLGILRLLVLGRFQEATAGTPTMLHTSYLAATNSSAAM